jgi:alpha-L-fucosidase
MTGGWGFQKQQKCAPAALLVTRLAKARAWGGNVLANFPVRADGDVTGMTYSCLAEVQAWMDKHRESVIDVQPGPYPEQSNVPVTIRGKTWYLHLLPKTEDGPAFEGPAVLRGVGQPKQATLLGTGQTLETKRNGDTLTIPVPQNLRTTLDDVIAIEW